MSPFGRYGLTFFMYVSTRQRDSFFICEKKIKKVKVVTYFSLFFKTRKQNKKENLV